MRFGMGILVVLLLAALLLASCAPGRNSLEGVPDSEEELAGFWQGLWHGFISPVVFIVSLFNKAVDIYEVHNNGGWYNFGFLLGASVIFGGSGGGAAKSRRRRWD